MLSQVCDQLLNYLSKIWENLNFGWGLGAFYYYLWPFLLLTRAKNPNTTRFHLQNDLCLKNLYPRALQRIPCSPQWRVTSPRPYTPMQLHLKAGLEIPSSCCPACFLEPWFSTLRCWIFLRCSPCSACWCWRDLVVWCTSLRGLRVGEGVRTVDTGAEEKQEGCLLSLQFLSWSLWGQRSFADSIFPHDPKA